MSLVICKNDVKSKFLSKWKTYVPAILQYAEKSRKKSIYNKLANVDEEGKNILHKLYLLDETSQHVAGLRVLSECLGKGEKTLCYIYEEHTVSNAYCV